MPDPHETLLEFPCRFPVKVMGYNNGAFRDLVVAIVSRHAELAQPDAVTVRDSRRGRYTSVTVAVRAESRAQLDAIYRELTAHERVVVAL